MAKICSTSYGTPPTEFLLNSNDWGCYGYGSTTTTQDVFDPHIEFKSEHEINDLFEDLNTLNYVDFSITEDIKKMTKDEEISNFDDNMENDLNGRHHHHHHHHSNLLDGVETKIRNKNCMWSGTTTTATGSAASTATLSTSASSSVSDNGETVPLAVVTGGIVIGSNQQQTQSQQQQQQNAPPPSIVVAKKIRHNNLNKLQQQQMQQNAFTLHTSIKVEPIDDDCEQQLQQYNIPNSKTLLRETAEHLSNLQHIPPGTSLLRKSNVQQQLLQRKQQQQQQQKLPSIKIPYKCTSEFVRERDQLLTTTTLNGVGGNQQQQQQQSNNNQKNRNNLYGRPETPHSLDDDDDTTLIYGNNTNHSTNNQQHQQNNQTPSTTTTTTNDEQNDTGFSHNVDLRACIMGSNNISLPAADPKLYIDQLSQQLQDTTKNQLDFNIFGTNPNHHVSLSEVMDVLGAGAGNDNAISSTYKMTTSMRNLQMAKSMRTSDYSEDYSEDDDDNVSLNGSSCDSMLSSQMNDNSLCSKMENSPITSPLTTSSSSSSRSPKAYQRQQQQQQQNLQSQSYLHSDHSYTRCKDGMEDLGNLETPSDSDEEIDVVSIGDKKLPTNPSDKDRRVLQTKVAHKFSKRVVKTANGVRTIPPRRRGSFELPYTPASSSPVKSVANSRYPSPASTPYHQNQYNNNNNMPNNILMNANSNLTTTINDKSRKRINGILSNNLDYNNGNGSDYALPPVKKCRNKKQFATNNNNNNNGNNSSSSSSSSSSNNAELLKRHYSFDETADTIEKRNLHNDMERQRRIGLKNLFDSLKKQIPSIKDKERAPKVNILREAAKLCEALTHEDEQLMEQKLMLREQLRMRQELLARLRNLKQEE